MIWHSNTVADVLTELHVDPTVGLTQQEAAERLNEYGKNCLQRQTPLTFRRAFSKQLRSPDTILLLAVSGLVLILNLYTQWLREIPTAWHIPLIVTALTMVAALLTAWRQYRAVVATASLHTLSALDSRVLRDGTEQMCSAHTLVPGDIILLGMGDIVPADCRLIEADRLRCDEGILISTTMPTEKYAEPVFDDITPLAQRTNMLYAGTTVTFGTATAVVVTTGMRSEKGHAASRGEKTSTELPAQKQTAKIRVWWGIGAAILSLIFLIVGLLRQDNRSAVLLVAATMAMAVFPKNIADTVARLTARSIQCLSQRKVRLHHPEAAEMLGKVSVVCTEQETLYQGNGARLCRAFVSHRMVDLTATKAKAPGLAQLLRLATLNTYENDSVDTAILAYATDVGIDKSELLIDMPRIGELTPSALRRTGVHLAGEETLILVSGEWRSLLPLCIKGDANELTDAATTMEMDGLQVMAITYRLSETAPAVYATSELERDLTCVGLLGIQLPLRANAKEAANLLPSVRTILFSNDPVETAMAAARQINLSTTDAITAQQVELLSDEELGKIAETCNVYCGLNPQQKQRIVTMLQQQGQIVAVTACHSEEAALLEAADIGCVRGTVATDVIKRAADIILTDDNYASLMAALWEGRQLKQQILCAYIYFGLCSLVIAVIGIGCLTGIAPLHLQAILMAGLHLLLMVALPIPLRSQKSIIEKK